MCGGSLWRWFSFLSSSQRVILALWLSSLKLCCLWCVLSVRPGVICVCSLVRCVIYSCFPFQMLFVVCLQLLVLLLFAMLPYSLVLSQLLSSSVCLSVAVSSTYPFSSSLLLFLYTVFYSSGQKDAKCIQKEDGSLFCTLLHPKYL